jgi:hypothetical protein
MTDKRQILAIIIVMALWITASTMDYNDAVQAAQPEESRND